jgi:hypothetical protein
MHRKPIRNLQNRMALTILKADALSQEFCHIPDLFVVMD